MKESTRRDDSFEVTSSLSDKVWIGSLAVPPLLGTLMILHNKSMSRVS